MSVITVQLGQCGNQIGRQLFSTLHNDALGTLKGGKHGGGDAYCETSLERFFHVQDRTQSRPLHATLEARAVLVDMESKAVQQTLLEADRTGHWAYDPSSVYVQKRGSGNNWANGYNHHGPRAAEQVLEMIQSQAEKCDYLSGFIILMSVAGGTGSGVGSYLTECVRDSYGSCSIFNPVVWPYTSGEVIVQDYNAVLTTKHLQSVADAVVLLQNDQLQKACSKLLLLKDISFTDLNRIISHSLAGVLQPSFDINCLTRGNRHGDNHMLYNQCLLHDIQTKLCPLSDFRFLSLKSIPQMPERSQAYTRYLWSGLMKHLRQMLVCDAPIEEGMDWSIGSEESLYTYTAVDLVNRAHHVPRGTNKSLANLLVVRGNELESLDTSPFIDPSLYGKWTPPDFSCSVWGSEHQFNKYEKSCTLLSNSQSCVLPLDTTCRKAWQMYSSKAYVHQYLQNGLSEQDFVDGFLCVEQIIKSYATVR